MYMRVYHENVCACAGIFVRVDVSVLTGRDTEREREIRKMIHEMNWMGTFNITGRHPFQARGDVCGGGSVEGEAGGKCDNHFLFRVV